MNPDLTAIAAMAHGIRRRVLAHTIATNGGYMSQACSSAELLATLYGALMDLPPVAAPLLPAPFPGVPARAGAAYFTGAVFHGGTQPDRDRFFLSPAHYALVLYAALIEAGRMAEAGLDDFNRDGSSVEMIGAEHSPGMEVTAGSLGQGLAQAAGIAHARKLKGERAMNWVFMSDGEFQSGMTWETIQALSFHRVGALTVVVDVNGQQCDGCCASVMGHDPLDARILAFGGTCRVIDGHDPAALIAAAQTPHADRPLFILGQTDPCRGLPLLRRNAPKLHYLRFKSDAERAEYRAILEGFLQMEGR